MKPIVMAAILFLAASIALQANAQRMRDNAEYAKQLEQFINESEIAGEINVKITAQETKSEELRLKIEDLELAQLDKQIDTLAETHPESKEKFAELKAIAEKNLKIRRELTDLQKQGRTKLDSLNLTSDESRKLVAAFNTIVSGQIGRVQDMAAQWNENQTPQGRQRPGRDNSKGADRNDRMQKQQEDLLNKVKQDNPDMYSLLVEQKKTTEELNKLRDDLMNAFRNYQKAQSGKEAGIGKN